MSQLRIFHIRPGQQVLELSHIPARPPANGFLWLAYPRSVLEQEFPTLQEHLLQLTGVQLVDLHLTDLLNTQLPSHFDYTSDYDVLVFRRLSNHEQENTSEIFPAIRPPARPSVLPGIRLPLNPLAILRAESTGDFDESHSETQVIGTDPVGFALFDNLLVSVHPPNCSTRDTFIQRLQQLSQSVGSPERAATDGAGSPRGNAAASSAGVQRLPTSPADLMLRLVNLIVDVYLTLRRDLTQQLDHWQGQLLNPQTYFDDWASLLHIRKALHHLEEICEDQRSAIADCIDALEEIPLPKGKTARFEHELLLVRSRDVLEHIERVAHHVNRLEQGTESAVQIHFNIQGNRTNDIMRALTAITALFLPLNLIAGIFGMNFEIIPGVTLSYGFWLALGGMLLIAAVLMVYFVNHNYFLPNRPRRRKPPGKG